MRNGIDCIGVGVGAIIRDADGRIFLMRRGWKSRNESGSWALPGGSVDFGETLENAVRRELSEEFGVAVEITQKYMTYDHILPEAGQHWIANVFIARITEGTPQIKEPDKCSEIGWFAPDALPSPVAKMSLPGIERYLRDN